MSRENKKEYNDSFLLYDISWKIIIKNTNMKHNNICKTRPLTNQNSLKLRYK